MTGSLPTIEIRDLRLSLDAGLPDGYGLLVQKAAGRLGVDIDDIAHVRLLKRSVDARRKSDVHFVATVEVELEGAGGKAAASGVEAVASAAGGEGAGLFVRPVPVAAQEGLSDAARVLPSAPAVAPIVVGSGPAGLFAALRLAQVGACPHLIERGGDIDARRAAVARFNAEGILDTDCNVQFGEGGAGTFSDGKLSTGTHDVRASQVLREFVRAGAPDEILWQAHPHIGTDLLPGAVKAIREQIVSLGGTVEFNTKLLGVHADRSGKLASIDVEGSDGRRSIAAHELVLACGHSARDTFEMLISAGMELVSKPFSIGVRIEHLQHDIDVAQYGPAAGHPALQAAEYRLATHLKDGRGVYSFCMCPGGTVVAAASEEGGVVTNGMSVFARDGVNSNAGFLVNVGPQDFYGVGSSSRGPLLGVDFQRTWEQAAFLAGMGASATSGTDTAGTYRAPAQMLGDFLDGRPTDAARASEGRVKPSYPRGVTWCDLSTCLPRYVVDDLREATRQFGRKLHGFDRRDAVLTGVETRSSSPVRMTRDDTLQSNIRGVFPCGEGAGYAGGIMSAAVDGIRVAETVLDAIASS